MTGVQYDLSTLTVVWRRDLMRFLRQPSRIVGALGQPLIFWGILGSGMASTFTIKGLDIGYLEYFFPGVVMMIVVFTSIFSSIGIIEDRSEGFLQTVLAGPGSRGALVLGKCLGGTTIAMIQASLFLALAPFAGFHFGGIDWSLLFSVLFFSSLGLAAFGFMVAWLVNNVQGYHAIQMTLLLPVWIVSGAMFPPDPNSAIFSTIMRFNPGTYAVEAIRNALYGGVAPDGLAFGTDASMAFGIVALGSVLACAMAVVACERSR